MKQDNLELLEELVEKKLKKIIKENRELKGTVTRLKERVSDEIKKKNLAIKEQETEKEKIRIEYSRWNDLFEDKILSLFDKIIINAKNS